MTLRVCYVIMLLVLQKNSLSASNNLLLQKLQSTRGPKAIPSLPQRVTVEFQIEKSVGCVRLLRVSRMVRFVIVEMFMSPRARNSDRAVDFDDAESFIISLVELNLIVGANNNAGNVLLSSLSLVEVKRAHASLVSVKLLFVSRFGIVEVLVLIVSRSIRVVGDAISVNMTFISELDMLGR